MYIGVCVHVYQLHHSTNLETIQTVVYKMEYHRATKKNQLLLYRKWLNLTDTIRAKEARYKRVHTA